MKAFMGRGMMAAVVAAACQAVVGTAGAQDELQARREARDVRKLHERAASDFWRELRDGKLAEAEKRLVPALREKLAERGLGAYLDESIAAYGKLQDYASFREEQVAGEMLLEGATRWEKVGKLPSFVSFDEQNRIDGLWVDAARKEGGARSRAIGRLEQLSQQARYSLTAMVVDSQGKAVEKSSIAFWQSVDPDQVPRERRQSLWRDTASGHAWQQVAAASTGASMSAQRLLRGTYRVTARDRHDSNGMAGLSEPIEIGGAQTQHEITVRLMAGGRLVVQTRDADTAWPVRSVSVSCRLVDPRYPDWTFRPTRDADPVVFENLPPGEYELSATRRASDIDSLVYEMAGEPRRKVQVQEGDNPPVVIDLRGRLLTEEEIDRRWGWTAYGRVIAADGSPIDGAEVRVATGWGTLAGGGRATTTADGSYRLRFGEGIWMEDPSGVHAQAAVFWVSKDGYVVQQRTQPSSLLMARKLPEADAEVNDARLRDPVKVAILKEPFRLDFVLAPAAKVSVKLQDAEGQPLDMRGLAVVGKGPDNSSREVGSEGRWDLLPGAVWWFVYASDKLGVDSVRSQPVRLPAAGDYRLTLTVRPDPKRGVHVLEVASLTGTDGADIAPAAVEDDPLARPALDEPLQQRGRELLKQMVDRNRLWLTFEPQPVAAYSYDFRLEGREDQRLSQRFSVEPGKGVAGVVRHGISHVSVLHHLAEDPSRATFRRLDIGEERIEMTYALPSRASISAGNGVQGTWRGFFSTSVREGTLVIDARRLVPLEHRTFRRHSADPDPIVESFSQYHEVVPGQFAPLATMVDGSHTYRWTFQAFDAGLWLFARSYTRAPDGGWTTVASADGIRLGDQPVQPAVVGKPDGF